MIFHDRYSAAGFNRPDVVRMCKRCEGMGFSPKRTVQARESIFRGPPKRKLDPKSFIICPRCTRPVPPLYFGVAKDFPLGRESDSYCDGWHVESCEGCNGTGSSDGIDRRRT